jgi:hypothetical protein
MLRDHGILIELEELQECTRVNFLLSNSEEKWTVVQQKQRFSDRPILPNLSAATGHRLESPGDVMRSSLASVMVISGF